MSDRVDQLISRIVEGEATQGQWDEFSQVAESDPAWWAHLARSQRDAAEMSTTLNDMVSVADRVSLPLADAAERPTVERAAWWRGVLPRLPVGAVAWGGWAVAALVALAALPGLRRGPEPVRRDRDPVIPGAMQPVAVEPAVSLEQAWEQYLDLGRRQGRVLGEIPARILINAQEVPGRGYDLYYLRPVLETMQVPEMYRFNGFDESGEPVLIKYEAP